ncbi:MAG: hypothetical protein HY906_20895 [Deltaproteobacteria bacterium]|nr:hypothetical protein [Deltaproteobacteria bacterium]
MSSRALTLAVALGAIGGSLLPGCGPAGPATYVWVDVEAQPAVRGVTKLEVTVRQGGESITKTFGDGVAPFTLPTDFTVTPNSHLGTLTVDGVAFGADDVRAATGSVSVAITAGDQPHATLTLVPVDFQVNTTIAGSQIVTDYGGQSGRQAAAAADGSLVAVFENISTLGRFDGMGRLFDGDGAARPNAVSHTKDDFVLNQLGTESVYFVAVAAAPAGGFLATWADFSLSPGVINVRAFDPTGSPSTEVTVSVLGTLELGAVHAAAFGDGSYVVVWSQARSSTDLTHEIQARLLDPTGQPRRNSTTGNNLDFAVGAFTTHDLERPAVTVGPDQSFVVAWIDLDPTSGGAVHAQRFSTEGQARGSQLVVAPIRMAFPEGPNLAATPDGYLVVYTDEGTSPTDTDVLVRFLGQDGLPTQPGYRVNTSTDGAQYEPAIAVAADGRTLVVWTDAQSRPDDTDSGSVRGRALHPFGLPIGDDFVINHTTPKAQHFPSVAAAAHGAFLVTWQDESAVGPDVDQSGIRGRMIYPDYVRTGGGVGAACGGGATCDTELQCVARGTGSFCHIGCSEAAVGQPCPTYGGLCTSAAAAGTTTPVCLFR